MRKVLASLLLAITALTPPPSAGAESSAATKVRVRLAAPSTVDHDTARLRGKVTGRHAVGSSATPSARAAGSE